MAAMNRQQFEDLFDKNRQEHEKQISVLCDIIGELLPPGINADRAAVISSLADIVFEFEQDLHIENHNPISAWLHGHTAHTKDMKRLAKLLREVAVRLNYEGIIDELEHPDMARDILYALHEKAEHYSNRPKLLKQGNVQTPVGACVHATWEVLNPAGITGMRKASSIVAELLIATVPEYNTRDSNTLAKSCYQLIRESKNKIG